MKRSDSRPTRRAFLLAGASSAISLSVVPASGVAPPDADDRESPAGGSPSTGAPLRIGLTTYMFKHYDLDQTIAMAKRVAVGPIVLRSNLVPLELPPEQVRAAVEKTEKAGLEVYGGGVIYMREERDVHRAFEYSKIAGFKLITASIEPALLPLVERKVKEHDIRVAIHNHGPEDRHYPTPVAIYEKVERFDARIGICHDTGHTQRAGMDPSEATLKTADRTYDVHLKDVNAATGSGHSTELGRGLVDLPRFLRTLVKIGYTGIVGVEYEKQMQDLLPGLAESVGYARGAIDAIREGSGDAKGS